MNNKEKFIEVFGFEPDTETMIPVCPPRGVECPFMDDGIYSECHCELWWGREYKEPKTDVLDKIRAEIEKLQKMCDKNDLNLMAQHYAFGMVLDIIDKYKAESEDTGDK